MLWLPRLKNYCCIVQVCLELCSLPASAFWVAGIRGVCPILDPYTNLFLFVLFSCNQRHCVAGVQY